MGAQESKKGAFVWRVRARRFARREFKGVRAGPGAARSASTGASSPKAPPRKGAQPDPATLAPFCDPQRPPTRAGESEAPRKKFYKTPQKTPLHRLAALGVISITKRQFNANYPRFVRILFYTILESFQRFLFHSLIFL